MPRHPHDPIGLVDDERHLVAAIPRNLLIDKIILQLLPPVEPERPEPVVRAGGYGRQRVSGNGRAATTATAGLLKMALPAEGAASAETTQPASRSATSPGIDSEYLKRFASRPTRGRSPPLLVKTSDRTAAFHAQTGTVDGTVRRAARRAAGSASSTCRNDTGRPAAACTSASRTVARATAAGSRSSAGTSRSQTKGSGLLTTVRASFPRRLLNPVPFLARQHRFVGEHVDNRRIEPALQQRQQLRADAIARDADIVVRLVVDERLSALLEKGPQVAAPAVEQGPDDAAAAGVHARQAARPRAAQEAEQKRLGLIVARVPERDGVGFEANTRLLEELVARRARGVFKRTAPGPGARRDIVAVRVKRPAKARRQSSAKGLLVVGRRTQLMIQMDDAGDPQLVALRELAPGGKPGRPNRSRPTARRARGYPDAPDRAPGWWRGHGRAAASTGAGWAGRRMADGRLTRPPSCPIQPARLPDK